MSPSLRQMILVPALLAVGCSPALETDGEDTGDGGPERTADSLPECSEAAIRAAAPSSAGAYLDRAFDWVHRGVPYCQCVSGAGGPYRTDCSGFVSYVWSLSAPGLVTTNFATGIHDTGASVAITWNDLTPGDALNFGGTPGGAGHIMLFAGWLDGAHTRLCAIEESHHGTPAHISQHSLYDAGSGWGGWGSFRDIFRPVRKVGYAPSSGSCDEACGHFGCACVNGQCSGGFCDGSGCSAEETAACGHFGCNCVDHKCNGGYCDGTGCTAREIINCGHYGVNCVDHKCNGGFGPGTGCTARETLNCGNYGVNCVDHQCAGGFGPGSGCTARETLDAQKSGCGCVDHKPSGGSCAGTGCTARETLDCQHFGCGCELGKCKGGFCK